MMIKWMISLGRIGTVALVFAASAASAGVIYSFSGTITGSYASGQAPADSVLEGDAFSGRLVYTPGLTLAPEEMAVSPIMQASFSNGIASWGSAFGAYDVNSNAGLGGYNLWSGSFTAPGVTPPSTAHHDDQQAIFTLPDVIRWSDQPSNPGLITLPDDLDLDRFSGGEFQWDFRFPDFMDGSDGHLYLEGSVDRLVKVTVPEPNALILLAMGVVLLMSVKTKAKE